MDQWYLQVSSWTRTAVCTVLFALCTLCPSALGWALTGYSGHFEQQWNWRDSCVLSLTFCVCPRVMQLLLFCGHHPINTAADWWSLQQLSAAPWHILYTQIQMFTNTCSVCCLQRLEDFWVTATHFTWCFGHNNLNLEHDGMKSITSVQLNKELFWLLKNQVLELEISQLLLNEICDTCWRKQQICWIRENKLSTGGRDSEPQLFPALSAPHDSREWQWNNDAEDPRFILSIQRYSSCTDIRRGIITVSRGLLIGPRHGGPDSSAEAPWEGRSGVKNEGKVWEECLRQEEQDGEGEGED